MLVADQERRRIGSPRGVVAAGSALHRKLGRAVGLNFYRFPFDAFALACRLRIPLGDLPVRERDLDARIEFARAVEIENRRLHTDRPAQAEL